MGHRDAGQGQDVAATPERRCRLRAIARTRIVLSADDRHPREMLRLGHPT
jgi:hypothetical protein